MKQFVIKGISILTTIAIACVALTACRDSNGDKGGKTTSMVTSAESHVEDTQTAKNTEVSPTPKPTPKPTPTSTPTPTPAPSAQELLESMTLDNLPVIDGSTATIPLAIGLMKKLTGCTEILAEEQISFSTTDPSYHQLAEGHAELLLVYEPSQPTIDELDVFNTMDVREIGLDALVFIVNEDNPVESLTADQIRGIYSGEITNWSQVGGANIDIVPFQRPVRSGSQTLMLNLMMKGKPMLEAGTEIRESSEMGDLIEDIASYNNSANAIGYSVYYYAKNMYTQPGLKFIAVDGVAPSEITINSREYGYVNAFYGIIAKDPTPRAAAVLDWLLTEEGQTLLADCGYVPILQKN